MYVYQLAEAILTEPASGDDAGSIRLADTRTGRRSSNEDITDEHAVFLPGDDSDSDDGELVEREELEGSMLQERQQVMRNASAQLSRMDIGSSQDPGDDADGDSVKGGGGLSAKAGIILVRLQLSTFLEHLADGYFVMC